jgi:hypothetical protein
MTAPIAVTYPPANLLFFCDHPWPVPSPCELGIGKATLDRIIHNRTRSKVTAS